MIRISSNLIIILIISSLFYSHHQFQISNLLAASVSDGLKENTAPVSNAGPDQTVFEGDRVQLDGTDSTDADGDRLEYLWRFIAKPQGSKAELSDPSA